MLFSEDADHFGLGRPDFSLVQEIESDMAKQEETWSFYESYSNDLESMAKEDWISFRCVVCLFVLLECLFLAVLIGGVLISLRISSWDGLRN